MSTGQRKRWGIGRKLLLQVALLPLLLLVVEFAYRGWKSSSGEPHDPATVEADLLSVADTVETPLIAFNAGREDGGEHKGLTARRIPSPFYGWDYENNFELMVERADYFETDKSREIYDIVILGGSVAGGFGAYGADRLVQQLQKDPRLANREVNIIRGARGGFKQPQQLNYLIYVLGLGWKPDAVINLDGFNEIAIGNQNAGMRAHPLHPSVPHWGHLLTFGRLGEKELQAMWDLRDAKRAPRRLAERFIGLGLQRSAVLSDLARDRCQAARYRYTLAHRKYESVVRQVGRSSRLFGPPPPTDLESTLGLIVQAWMSSSRAMQAICDEAGVYYVHSLQPTLHDSGSKPLTPQEIRTGTAGKSWVEGAGRGYPMLRKGGEQLRSEGVNHIGGSMVFEQVAESLYIDACHFIPQGQEILADHIAAGFLASLPTD